MRKSFTIDYLANHARLILPGTSGWEATLDLEAGSGAAEPLYEKRLWPQTEQAVAIVRTFLETLDLSIRTRRLNITYQALFELEARMGKITMGMGDTWRGPVSQARQDSALIGGEGSPWSLYLSSGLREGLGFGAPEWNAYFTFSPKASATIGSLQTPERKHLEQLLVDCGSYYVAVLYTMLDTSNFSRLPALFGSVSSAFATVKWKI